jgi:hypothetical protein
LFPTHAKPGLQYGTDQVYSIGVISPAHEVPPMTPDLLATPDGPDPRHWLTDNWVGCLQLVGLFLLSVALPLLIRMCLVAAFD